MTCESLEYLDRFEWLYDPLLASAGSMLGGTAQYAESKHASLPAFHFMCSKLAFSLPVFAPHSDLREVRRMLEAYECEEMSGVALTLAVRLPSTGGGLAYAEFDMQRCGCVDDFSIAMDNHCFNKNISTAKAAC